MHLASVVDNYSTASTTHCHIASDLIINIPFGRSSPLLCSTLCP